VNLKELVALQSKTSALQANRHEQSRQSCETATQLLAKIYQADKIEKSWLSEAFETYNRSIQLNRQNADAYLGCAYLQLILGNSTEAVKYVREAVRIAPDSAEGQDLIGYLSGSPRPEAASANTTPALTSSLTTPARPQQTANNRYDIAFDELESRIQAECRLINGLNQLLQASDPDAAQLKREWLRLQQNWQQIEAQLRFIERELDTSNLIRLTRPIQAILKALEIKSLQVEQRHKLLQRIDSLGEHARTWMQKARKQPGEAASHLENLLDACDRLADELDEMEQQDQNIEKLMAPYEALLQQIESFRELLEDFET
jgi:tetratricopeptide (TPR) repeat protein